MKIRVTLPKTPRSLHALMLLLVPATAWLTYNTLAQAITGHDIWLNGIFAILNGATFIFNASNLLHAYRYDRMIRYHERRIAADLESIVEVHIDEAIKEASKEEPADEQA